nr:Lrp/AsnC family transcriptional regulator [Gammaproteobacteria bacterium]
MDARDRALVNALQGGFPITERPFAEAGARLGMGETEVIARVERLTAEGVLSRFGPLYDAERLGGAVTLAAMQLPPGVLEQVAETVNAFPEVAHNYARDHEFNLWFVVSVDSPDRLQPVLDEI